MRRRLSPYRIAPGHTPSNRFAWWAAFLTTIALIVLLNAVRADAAALPGSAGPSLPVFADLGSEEEEDEEEEFEEGAEEECDAEGEDECVEGAEEESPPRECRLTSTSATVSAYPRGRRVVLTIHYTARVPTRVEISYSLRGSRGGLKMDGDRARFGASGSFRHATTVSPAQMTRVLGAKNFSVEIRPRGAPAYCHSYFDQRLTVRRATAHGPVWSS
jgi:hypothetical protein